MFQTFKVHKPHFNDPALSVTHCGDEVSVLPTRWQWRACSSPCWVILWRRLANRHTCGNPSHCCVPCERGAPCLAPTSLQASAPTAAASHTLTIIFSSHHFAVIRMDILQVSCPHTQDKSGTGTALGRQLCFSSVWLLIHDIWDSVCVLFLSCESVCLLNIKIQMPLHSSLRKMLPR